MKMKACLFIIWLCILSLSSCGPNVNEQKTLTCAPYIPAHMGYYGDDVYLLIDYRMYAIRPEDGAVEILCHKEACPHSYSPQAEHTCQAALESGAAMGVYNDKVFVLEAMADAPAYTYALSEWDPKTGEKTKLTSFIDLVDNYWGTFYDGYFYYIVNALPGFKISLNRVALAEGAQPELLWESDSYEDYPYLCGYQICVDRCFVSVSEKGMTKLTVYDIAEQEVMIEDFTNTSVIVYGAGCLYYIDADKHTIEVYDMASDTVVDSIAVEFNDITWTTLACDQSYLYLSESVWNEANEGFDTYIHIYDHHGALINTVITGKNVQYDGVDFLFSTDKYIYIGNRHNYWPRTMALYCLDKATLAQGGTVEVVPVYNTDQIVQ